MMVFKVHGRPTAGGLNSRESAAATLQRLGQSFSLCEQRTTGAAGSRQQASGNWRGVGGVGRPIGGRGWCISNLRI